MDDVIKLIYSSIDYTNELYKSNDEDINNEINNFIEVSKKLGVYIKLDKLKDKYVLEYFDIDIYKKHINK